MRKNRCVIVGAAPILKPEKIAGLLRPDDFFVYCDAGLNHSQALNRWPDLVVGDFDSHPLTDFGAETIKLPSVKDDTDTAYAVKECIERGFLDFLFIGCVGLRLDHTLGNLSILLSLADEGLNAVMVDDYSVMEIISPGKTYEIDPSYPYFSLVVVDGSASGITIKNAKYCLSDRTMEPGFSLGISNEPLFGQTATVSLKEGRLLLLRVF